jgi:hypothetical protein
MEIGYVGWAAVTGQMCFIPTIAPLAEERQSTSIDLRIREESE